MSILLDTLQDDCRVLGACSGNSVEISVYAHHLTIMLIEGLPPLLLHKPGLYHADRLPYNSDHAKPDGAGTLSGAQRQCITKHRSEAEDAGRMNKFLVAWCETSSTGFMCSTSASIVGISSGGPIFDDALMNTVAST